jgi:hypothetical protein
MYCKDSELLSEGVDEWLTCRPLLTRAVIAAMALHLANAITDAFRRGAVGFFSRPQGLAKLVGARHVEPAYHGRSARIHRRGLAAWPSTPQSRRTRHLISLASTPVDDADQHSGRL